MHTAEKPTGRRIPKRINRPDLSCCFNLYISIASAFRVVKRHCLDVSGYRMQLDAYWLLLLIGSVGSVRCIPLHLLYCHSMSTIGLRNTQNRLKALIGCGLVVCSNVGSSRFYSLSFQAEKLIFSGIDKSALLELSAMVKGIQDEERRASKVVKGSKRSKSSK